MDVNDKKAKMAIFRHMIQIHAFWRSIMAETWINYIFRDHPNPPETREHHKNQVAFLFLRITYAFHMHVNDKTAKMAIFRHMTQIDAV